MAGKIIADTIESAGSQISLNVGNVTILTASSTGLTLIPTTNVNVNLTNSIVNLTSGNVTNPSLTFSGNTSTGIYMPAANTIAFTTAGTEDMRIDSSGNVGIGTNSPTAPLDVKVGTGNFTVGLQGAGNALLTASATMQLDAAGASGAMVFKTVGTERMRIDASGNVGIGTSSPQRKLDVTVSDTSTAQLYLRNNNASYASGLVIYTNTGQASIFRHNGSSDTSYAGVDSVNIGSVTNNNVAFMTNNTVKMTIISGGQVGINATPASGNTFRVINIGTDNACQFGNASSGVYLPYASPTAWSSYSDSRLKDVIGNYENALEHILQLNPVKYTWKSDTDKKVNIGLLAQNVLEVVPEIVDENTLPNDGEDKTKYLSLRYTDLIPVLIGSIQELKAIVDAQAVEIAALKAK